MTAAASPDTWREKCWVSLTPQVATAATSTAVALEGIVETVDLDIAEKGIDVTPLINGGRVVKFTPMSESTIKFEAYPTDVAQIQQYFLGGTIDATQPIQVSAALTRTLLRCSILWTDDLDITGIATTADATSITGTGTPYTIDELKGRVIKVTSGTGINKTYVVASNTTSKLTVVSGSPSGDGVTTADTYIILLAGEGSVRSNQRAMRLVAADCRLTSAKRSFTDYNLKFTFELKFSPFDKAGTANLKEESTDGTQPLAVLASYTESVKW
jgi:hypothetical protein